MKKDLCSSIFPADDPDMRSAMADSLCMGNAPFYGLSGGISVFIYDIKYFHSYLSASFSYNYS